MSPLTSILNWELGILRMQPRGGFLSPECLGQDRILDLGNFRTQHRQGN